MLLALSLIVIAFQSVSLKKPKQNDPLNQLLTLVNSVFIFVISGLKCLGRIAKTIRSIYELARPNACWHQKQGAVHEAMIMPGSTRSLGKVQVLRAVPNFKANPETSNLNSFLRNHILDKSVAFVFCDEC